MATHALDCMKDVRHDDVKFAELFAIGECRNMTGPEALKHFAQFLREFDVRE